MAEQTEAKEQAQSQEATDGGSNGGHTGAVRTVAIAAATGAAALAAKKALSGRDRSGQGTQKSESGSGDDSMLVAIATSGWAAAKDSLLPFAEDAAGAAGDWVGRSGPEYMRDTIVPRFITSFERARKSSEQSD
jgi:hypothetical protein